DQGGIGLRKERTHGETSSKKPEVNKRPPPVYDSGKSHKQSTPVPIRQGNRLKDRTIPDTESKYGPSLHTRYAYQGIDRETGEILLAHLEAALEDVHYDPPRENEEDNKLLAELRAGWIAKAADLLTGAPDRLTP